jgi:hypothetical protein
MSRRSADVTATRGGPVLRWMNAEALVNATAQCRTGISATSQAEALMVAGLPLRARGGAGAAIWAVGACQRSQPHRPLHAGAGKAASMGLPRGQRPELPRQGHLTHNAHHASSSPDTPGHPPDADRRHAPRGRQPPQRHPLRPVGGPRRGRLPASRDVLQGVPEAIRVRNGEGGCADSSVAGLPRNRSSVGQSLAASSTNTSELPESPGHKPAA